ncbi:phosphatase PAP2 family protein [Sphingomonas sp.]|uniref:phosphatase PAP2 family protein n=1 Tax=Sphingomonas sp. TaxID=28214 RepID=UPI0031E39FCE
MSKRKKKPPKSARQASAVEHADAAIATRAGHYHRNPVVRLLGGASEIADQPPLIATSLATTAAGLLAKRPELVGTGLRMLASELVATGLKHIVKRRIDRTRPYKMLKDGRYKLKHAGSGASRASPWSSFPSGHTAGAVATARAIAHGYPQLALPAGIAAGAIALIQVPRRTHFPTDVVAGAAIGFLSEWLVDAAMRRFAPASAGSAHPLERDPPGMGIGLGQPHLERIARG